MKPYKDHQDWRDQFIIEKDKNKQIGALHSLLSEDGFENLLSRQAQKAESGNCLIFAIEQNLEPKLKDRQKSKLVHSALQMLIKNIFGVHLRNRMEGLNLPVKKLLHLIPTLNSCDAFNSELGVGSLGPVRKFLEWVILEHNPSLKGADQELTIAATKAVMCMREYKLFLLTTGWKADKIVLRHLKQYLKDRGVLPKKLSDLVKFSTSPDLVQVLAINILASAKIDYTVR
jgi:hypothetical protein